MILFHVVLIILKKIISKHDLKQYSDQSLIDLLFTEDDRLSVTYSCHFDRDDILEEFESNEKHPEHYTRNWLDFYKEKEYVLM